jgi:hypothetical protein
MKQAPHVFASPPVRFLRPPLLAMALLSSAWIAPLAHAQSFCASDGQARPALLLERFINADCAECWSDAATPALPRGGLALDWVVPGSKADDAPLAAVASRDALTRLEALRKAPQPGQWQQSKAVAGAKVSEKRRASAYRLRASHGVAFNGYVGVSIELKPLPAQSPTRQDGPWTAWLALVEAVPAGTEGSPVDRQLVRNLLVVPWSRQQAGGLERRSIALPEGTNPERISVVAWVEDSRGRMQAAVQSRCTER